MHMQKNVILEKNNDVIFLFFLLSDDYFYEEYIRSLRRIYYEIPLRKIYYDKNTQFKFSRFQENILCKVNRDLL